MHDGYGVLEDSGDKQWAIRWKEHFRLRGCFQSHNWALNSNFFGPSNEVLRVHLLSQQLFSGTDNKQRTNLGPTEAIYFAFDDMLVNTVTRVNVLQIGLRNKKIAVDIVAICWNLTLFDWISYYCISIHINHCNRWLLHVSHSGYVGHIGYRAHNKPTNLVFRRKWLVGCCL